MKIAIKLVAICLCLITVFSLSACQLSFQANDGKSAYDIAVEHGFEGSEEEWLESLKGERGDQGPQGKPGLNGDDGKDGTNGKDGLNAPSSVDGQLESSFVVVTEYVKANTGEDLSDEIQQIINTNPNRTIYFPDGEYLVSKPIKTSAKYDESVSLLLSNYAEIKASNNWSGSATDAVIMLGAAKKYNNIYQPGSNYFLEGGIINGNGRANGVSIDSGRETRIEGVSIKNTVIGLHIKYGANSGSSDADILNVNIVGTGQRNSIGVLAEGYDNNFDGMRITGIHIGVQIKGGGNFFRDIHPLIGDVANLYSGSIGFSVESGSNWFDVCYPDNFETGFKITTNTSSTFSNCYAFWWYKNSEYPKGYQITKEIGFHFTKSFTSTIKDTKIDFQNENNVENAYIKVGTSGGSGVIYNPRISSKNDDPAYLDYLVPLK